MWRLWRAPVVEEAAVFISRGPPDGVKGDAKSRVDDGDTALAFKYWGVAMGVDPVEEITNGTGIPAPSTPWCCCWWPTTDISPPLPLPPAGEGCEKKNSS